MVSNSLVVTLTQRPPVNAIKKAQKYIAKDPYRDSAKTLAQLVLSLESAEAFPLERLYALDMDQFDLALDILKEWRLDRYYLGKARLFEVSMLAHGMAQAGDVEPSGPRSADAAPTATEKKPEKR